MDHKGQHIGTDVDIKSEGLCQVLLELNRNVEGLNLIPPTVSVIIHIRNLSSQHFRSIQSYSSIPMKG